MKFFTRIDDKNVITCRLCARQIAEVPPLEIPLDGDIGPKAEKVQKMLRKHLETEHAQEVTQAIMIAAGFIPFLIWNAFSVEDPSVQTRLEIIRAPIFAMVRKNSLTDASLEHIVASLGLDPDDATKVNETMRAVRDACCEIGEHAPKMPEESRILQV